MRSRALLAAAAIRRRPRARRVVAGVLRLRPTKRGCALKGCSDAYNLAQDRASTAGMIYQQLINGLMLGASYALVAIGYTLIFGVLNLLYFAHGEIFMVGAFA